MSNERRTVRDLSRLSRFHGRVYVYLKDDRTGEQFLRAAEAEGFTFGDAAKPTQRHYAAVMAVNENGTINYVGAAGMAAFGVKAERIIRVDFAGYSNGGEYLL